MLIGHLAADPELRQTMNGHSVANFPLATNRKAMDGEGKKREVADFHRIIAWRGLADICGKYLKKGMPVLVEGRLINRSFDDKEGNRHFRTEIVADELNILTSRKAKGGNDVVGIKEIPEAETLREEAVEEEAVAV